MPVIRRAHKRSVLPRRLLPLAASLLPVLSVGAAETPARLLNLSVRSAAGTPIPGFVLAGEGTRPILLRAVGPGLAPFGLTGFEPNPRLTLLSGSRTVGENDDWRPADGPAMAAAGAFPLPAGSRDAALLTPLAAGAYTAPVNATGITLLEVYDAASAAAGPSLVNASTLAPVGTGAGVLIPGFVVGGTGKLRLLLRAIGPSLAGFGVTGTLANPTVTLYRGQQALATNDDWMAAANPGQVMAAAARVGAFPLEMESRDAVLLADLEAGAYTAVVSGVGGTSGQALFELYAVPPQPAVLPVGAWGLKADLLEPNSEMSVAELGGRIYVFGGYPASRVSVRTVQIYDSRTDTWRVSTPLPVALNHTVAAAVGNRIYVIGGQTGAGGAGPFVDTVYAFDPATETWSTRAPMPTQRSGGGATVVDGKIYVAGGRPPRGNDFAVYDPATDRWQTLPDLPTQRNHLGVAAIDRRIYVTGGRFGAGFESETTDIVEVFDVAAGTWSRRAPLPKTRGGVNSIVAHGYLHVFGGEGMRTGSGVFADHDVYDPVTDKWISLPPMPVPVHGATGAGFIDGLIHLAGGGIMDGGDNGTTLHQVYRPATRYP